MIRDVMGVGGSQCLISGVCLSLQLRVLRVSGEWNGDQMNEMQSYSY
jgi:hypothetical protein